MYAEMPDALFPKSGLFFDGTSHTSLNVGNIIITSLPSELFDSNEQKSFFF